MSRKEPEIITLYDGSRSRAVETPMNKATEFLNKARIPFEVKTDYHLKIGSLNYFPVNGTLHRDGDLTSRKRVSLDELAAVIRNERL